MSDSNPVLISGIIGGIALVATAVTIGYSIHTNAEEAKAEALRVEEAAKKKAEEAAKKKVEKEALRVAAKKKAEEKALRVAEEAKAEALRVAEEEKMKAEEAEALRVAEEAKAEVLRVAEEEKTKAEKAEALRIAKKQEKKNDAKIKRTQKIINRIHGPIIDNKNPSILPSILQEMKDNENAEVLHQKEQNAKKKAAKKEAAKKKAEEAAEALRQIYEGNNSVPQFNIRNIFSIFSSNQNEIKTVTEPKSPNSNNLTQLSQPYTEPYECTNCRSTFNNPTDFIKHLREHNFYNKLGIEKQLTSAEKTIKYAPHQVQFLRGPEYNESAPYIVHNKEPLLRDKGGIRKRKRTHKKHRRLHNRSHKR